MTLQPIKILFSTLKKGKIDTYLTDAFIVPTEEDASFIVLFETKRDLRQKQHMIEAAVQIIAENVTYECVSLFYFGMVCKYPIFSCRVAA